MQRDARNLPLSTDSPVAAAAFDRAVEHYLKYHVDTMALVNQALAADPEFLMGHVIKGYLMLAGANPAHRPLIARALDTARAGTVAATPREQRHVAALEAWARGDLGHAFGVWRELLDADPTDLLAVRICDTTYFRFGQTRSVLEQADRIAPHWSKDLPGYDCFLSVWGFAHEEAGDTVGAEAAIDAAYAADPTNFFTHHVKAHVLEMENRPREGCDWLIAQRGHWHLGNNLVHHLWWHRSLMQLELGERDEVLQSYDQNIRNSESPLTKAVPDQFNDLQNATSLLWRLEQLGLDAGNRWEELADKAEARIGDVTYLLLPPHLMMALAATGRDQAARRFLDGLRAAAERSAFGAAAITDVVIPTCEAALAHRREDHARVVALLWPRQSQIRLLGGSNAQRDLFTQILIDSAVKAEQRDVVAAMIAHETTARTVAPHQRVGYANAARWLEGR